MKKIIQRVGVLALGALILTGSSMTAFAQDRSYTYNYDYWEDVQDSPDTYSVSDIHFIKPGIGETTRVLLRRVPWKVIINQTYADAAELRHIYQLAAEKKIPCEISRVDLGSYKACGIIKKISDI